MRRTSIFTITLLLSLMCVPAHAASIREVDSVFVTWPGAPKPKANLDDVQKNIDGEVSANWIRFTTANGATEDSSIVFRFGKSIQNITISRAMPCDGPQSTEFMNQIRAETYQRLNLEDWSKRYLVILVPDAGCIWQGKALMGNPGSLGGVLTLHDTSSPFVITHELGHSLGIGHSNLLRCTSGLKDGPWGTDCRAVEYGGTIDVMSNVPTSSPLSTYHQWRLGLINNSQIAQSWTTEKIEVSASDLTGKTKAIFLRDNNATYWIEYRRKLEGAYGYQSGLVIYRTDPPPASAIVSPNPEDLQSEFALKGLSTDIWMLNMDNYRYLNGRVSGSMTLPNLLPTALFSGNISISATANVDESTALVSIMRNVDSTPPPTPKIVPTTVWRSPESEILYPGYEDKETAISSFEIKTNTLITQISGSNSTSWAPTYLNPLNPPKTLFVKDLPEGSYSLSIRSIDFGGNRSAWSTPENVFIDRGYPVLRNEFVPLKTTQDSVSLKWTGATDSGVGLCETSISDSNDFILFSDKSKQMPVFNIPNEVLVQGKATVTDCAGNAVMAPISIAVEFKSAGNSRKTGKWSEIEVLGQRLLKCQGKCSASFSANGLVSVLAGAGSADIFVSGKRVGSISQNGSQITRVAYSNNLGSARRVIRVSGENFALAGIVQQDISIGKITQLLSVSRVEDTSLQDANQLRLSKYGFLGEDFLSTWTVLPMPRGTTLQDPTLDLCEYQYASDADRKFRRQVTVTSASSAYSFLSTEVVDYGISSLAQDALGELKQNLAKCRTDKGGIGRNGLKVEYNFQDVTSYSSDLLPESQRVLVRATIGSGARVSQLLGFYQFSGRYFVGLYVVKQGSSLFSNQEAFGWSKVAGVLAKRLST